ncbi:MAG: polysaccharide pyruvyl transferase family protein [Azospirillaceae bacterium]|nr:polysaccharide pyruvyl transferase family protein [Azospirillaceae bacterium]
MSQAAVIGYGLLTWVMAVLEIFDHVAQFREKLAELISGPEYIFVDWPDYTNTGDHLIWLGAKAAMNSLGKHCLAELTAWDVRSRRLPNLNQDVTIVTSGGGNFGDIYQNFQVSREILLEKYPNNRVIVLPQTIHFSSPEKMNLSSQKFLAHKNCFIFTRDKRSRSLAHNFASDDRVFLAPDCAFFLMPLITYICQRVPLLDPHFEMLYIVRDDQERIDDGGASDKPDMVIDWCNEENYYYGYISRNLLDEFDLKQSDISRIFGAPSYFDLISMRRLILGMHIVGLGKNLKTDRLHAHILSCLLMKEHVFRDNIYGKNRSFYEAWTHSLKFIDTEFK